MKKYAKNIMTQLVFKIAAIFSVFSNIYKEF
jgi:hypothetical protein